MLYDNAQLIGLYSKVFQVTGSDRYREIVSQTIEFISSEMLSPEGGFYSALDADSEGVEGKFYIWSEKEIDKVLGGDSGLFKKYYNVTAPGNWEETNILFTSFSKDKYAESENMSLAELSGFLDKCRVKLMKVRNSRIKPGLDDKIITSWNALMIKSLCDAFKAFNVDEYKQIAIKAAEFAREKLLKEDYSLHRTYKNNQGKINAFLDDYAMMIDAFVSLYEVSFNEEYLEISGKLIDYVVKHFYNAETQLFYYTSDLEKQVVTRTTELSDNVIPSSNSVMAFNLFKFGHLMGNHEYISMSEKMAHRVKNTVAGSPVNYLNWLRFFHTLNEPFNELAITGTEAINYATRFNKLFHPATIVAATKEESNLPLLEKRFNKEENLFYVCSNHQCDLPLTDFDLVILRLQNKH